MGEIFNFLRTDAFLISSIVVIFILFILYIANTIKLSKITKNYKEFMKKVGNGTNIDEMLREYIKKVDIVEQENQNLINHCKQMNKKIDGCFQKIGLVRYNAFQDVGSDLSFALAILNYENDGIVLNGIYSRETSNIYAKPIKNGESTYTLSEEEKEAIKKAINKE